MDGIQKPNQEIVPPQAEAQGMLAVIERAEANPQVDVAKLEKLLEIQTKILERNALIAFNNAMADAQAEIPPVVRDAENSHTKSKYALLETIDAAIRPIYTKHGFALTFNSVRSEKDVVVLCDVLHREGHTKQYQLDGALDTTGSQGKANKTDIQGKGSSVSYLQRYLTKMIFNVVLKNEDNDGNSPVAFVSTEQAAELDNLIRDTKADRAAFLKYFDAKDVQHVKSADFRNALGALKTKAKAASAK